MGYDLIIEKNDYAVIRNKKKLPEFLVVRGLNKENGCWSYSCGIYPYGNILNPNTCEAEALAGALEEFRQKTETDYHPTTQLEFEKIKKELLMKMKFSDITIEGISDSLEYKLNCAYNEAIRDVISFLQEKMTD